MWSTLVPRLIHDGERIFIHQTCPNPTFCVLLQPIEWCEVNYTFCGRHVLRRTVADCWLTQTRENFISAFRGPKPITHFTGIGCAMLKIWSGGLKECYSLSGKRTAWGQFFSVVQNVYDRRRNARRIPEPLAGRTAPQLRIPAPFVFTDEVYETLLLDRRDELTTPEILTANFVYLRLRKIVVLSRRALQGCEPNRTIRSARRRVRVLSARWKSRTALCPGNLRHLRVTS